MSKRKQMRPSKFDLGKKDEDGPKSLNGSPDDTNNRNARLDNECKPPESDQSLGVVDQLEASPKSNIAQVVAAVARSRSTSTVIRSANRKRTLSAALDSAVIRRGSKAGAETEDASGETDDDADGPLDSQQKTVEQVSLSHDSDDRRKGSRETPHSSQDQTIAPADGRQLDRTPGAVDSADLSRPMERRQLVKCFVCPYCETGFSNPKTLEAHQTIYCTKKPADGKLSPNAVKRARLPSSNSPAVDGHHHHGHAITVAAFSEPQVAAGRIRWTSSTMPSIRGVSPDFPPLHSAAANTSVILLPCAYSRSNVVQVIGRPQTIIPVAVPRSFSSSDFAVMPLLLEESWCWGIEIMDDKLPLSHSTGSFPSSINRQSARNGFALPLATRAASREGPSTSRGIVSDSLTVPVTNGRPRSSEGAKCGESRGRSPPLDLTKKPFPEAASQLGMTSCSDASLIKRRSLPQLKLASTSESATVPPKTAPTPPLASSIALHPKNYACPKCGVAFSSRKTLEGHQAYYCKATKSASDALSDPSRPVQKEQSNPSTSAQTLCCQYCDQTTATVWQLLQHMKAAHSLGAAYLCTLCGYRGFSMRGMKSHLKHAHADQVKLNAVKDEEAFLAKHVKRTKLFDEYDSVEADDDASHSTDSHGEIDVDDRRVETEKSEDPLSSLDGNSKIERKQQSDGSSTTDGQKPTTVADGQPSTSTSGPTLVSKYACQFCAYKSPYKGNVKRHLALVHKMEKQKNAD